MSAVSVNKLHQFTGHRDAVYRVERYDEHHFLSCGGDGQLVMWDVKNPELGHLISAVNASVYAFAVDDHRIYVGKNRDGIVCIDAEKKSVVSSVHLGNVAIFDIKKIDNQIWVVTDIGELYILHSDGSSIIKKIKISTQSLRSIAFHPLQNHVVIAGTDQLFHVIHRFDHTLIHRQIAHQMSVFHVSFSPDSQYLVSSSRDAHIKIWGVTTELFELKHDIVAHHFAINHFAFHDSLPLMASVSMDKSIKIWDTQLWRLLKVIDKARHAGHGTSVNRCLWIKNDQKLITCSDDRTVTLWSIENNP